MKSARYYGPRDIRIDDIPGLPAPGEHEVTLDVVWGGICGTDLHEYLHGPRTIDTKEQPHGITGDYLPVAFGHKFTGRVSALPEGHNGNAMLARMGSTTFVPIGGILDSMEVVEAELASVETRMCHILPDDGSVDLNSAVFCQPLTVGKHALSSSGLSDYTGLDVLVLGGGPVGLTVLLNLRAKGVGVGLSGRVFVSELSMKRCEMIRNLGLSNDLIKPINEDVAKECRASTNGKGVDVVFDAAGVEAAMVKGMETLKLRGTYVNIAGWSQPFQVPLQYAMFRGITIKFSLGNNDVDYREVVEDFVAGKFTGAEALITRRLPVEELTEKGLEELVRNKDEHVKIVATWKKGLLNVDDMGS